MKLLLALAVLAYALIKLIRALPNTPESQPEPDEWTFEGDPWQRRVLASEGYCPCGGQCHHSEHPCSLSCEAGEGIRTIGGWAA